MNLATITVSDFKARFYRDFYFANQNPNQVQTPPEGSELVQDVDIDNAFADATVLLNQSLFTNQDNAITQGYLYLTAHCLCLNIKAAWAGLVGTGSGAFPIASRSGGSLSEAFAVPKAYTDDSILAQYAQTTYGQKYLAMVLPMLRGNMQAVWGGALPAR